MVKKYVFFRNDDLRDVLDAELINITELFIKHKIPIIHAVEPFNISKEVSDWLYDIKKKYPDLIEIIQHGYHHNLNNQFDYGMEFGDKRSYNDQYDDLQKGSTQMDTLFSDQWEKIMTFPYGSYNRNTLKAINDLNYTAISTSIDFSKKHRIKDLIGRTLRQHILLTKKISYHNQKRKPFNFYDYAISINLIKKYLGYDEALHYSLDELISKTNFSLKHTDLIGILLHHRFHKEDYMSTMENYIKYLKDNNFTFVKFSDIK